MPYVLSLVASILDSVEELSMVVDQSTIHDTHPTLSEAGANAKTTRQTLDY